MNSVLRSMVNPQSIQAVLFDAVGTLIYAEPPVADVYHAAGRRYGSQLDRVAVERRFRAAMRRRAEQLLSAEPPPTSHAAERAMWREIVCEVFDDLPRETAGGELFETLWRHFARPQSWRLYDDVAGAWRELESRGYRLGVASNFDDRLAGVCRGLPPLDACRHLFWSARIGHSRPSREFFRRVEQALGLAPTELLLVGDDWHSDIEGARRAGWSAVYLDRSGQSKSPGHIASLMELPNLLAP